ncbi:MAG TPA: hypothetical protein DCY36_08160, partial [Acidimicrobiaceae bacterium]|nr:hypothetical protein [Acidimicrobiaceae bacterium]
MAQMAVGLLSICLVGFWELFTAKILFLLINRQRIPRIEVVNPSLSDDVTATSARLTIGNNGNRRLIFISGVTGTV